MTMERQGSSDTASCTAPRRIGLGGFLRSLVAMVLTVGERGLHKLQGADKMRGSTVFLKENYAPVEGEAFATELQVTEGSLPGDLQGLYARIGPNPLHIQGDYHWFDGDGFIHAVRLSGGKASYSAQYVKTSKLKQEMAAGRALFTKFADLGGPCLFGHLLIEKLRGAFGILDSSQGKGTANTALVFHGKSLFALHEGDQPYELFIHDDGSIETVRRVHKSGVGTSSLSWFTAHPKIHAGSGKMYAFSYQLEKKPYATFYSFNQHGERDGIVPLDLSCPVMIHDFGITERYAIIPEASLRFKIGLHLLHPAETIFKFDRTKPTRFFVLPLEAKHQNEGRWFVLPPSWMFHVVASWEERKPKTASTVIKSFILRYDNEFDLRRMKDVDANATLDEVDRRGLHLWEYTFDMETGNATASRAITQDKRTYEFTSVHPRTVGSSSPTRFAYAGVHDRLGRLSAVAKIDLQRVGQEDMGAVKIVNLGDSVTGGEAMFVPRGGGDRLSIWGKDGDDGYLLMFAHNAASGKSDFRVYDAKTMSPTPIARVLLPRRVPYGFHTTWVSEHQIRSQQRLNSSSASSSMK